MRLLSKPASLPSFLAALLGSIAQFSQFTLQYGSNVASGIVDSRRPLGKLRPGGMLLSAVQTDAAFERRRAEQDPTATAVTNTNDPTPQTIDTARDMQPLDTWIGSAITKKFIEEPVKSDITVLPTQESLDLAYGCPSVVLPKTVVVNAPTGCTSTRRTAGIATPTGTELQTWTEQCYQLNAPNLIITDKKTGGTVTQAWTRPTGYTNIVDLTDCNGNTVYTIHEMIYHLSGSSIQSCKSTSGILGGGGCSGDVYLKYEIIAKSGVVVAVTSYIPVFAESFKLVDPSNGKTIATLGKNGAWSPSDACPVYEKKWYVSFETTTSTGGASLTNEDRRWVIAAFMSVIAVRDEDRNSDGGVRWSACTKRSLVVSLVMVGLVLVGIGILLSLWAAFRCRENLIRFFFRLQERVLPRAMHKIR
ncbi:unnamed protein product [Amoebophrya sp. A25]|nr:unnamed protein product [Amoebophrya sp. A25]|eukprot:GSA25T00007576001.1